MNVAVMKTKAEEALGEQFEAAAARLPGAGWVKELRKTAIGVFEAVGLPHRRIEEWKYTDLRERLREAFPPAQAAGGVMPVAKLDAALGRLAGLEADRLVFIDGVFRAELSAWRVLQGARRFGHGRGAGGRSGVAGASSMRRPRAERMPCAR